MKVDPVEIWLSKVEKRHSGSKNTELMYRTNLRRFCMYAETTPEQLVSQWDAVKFDLRTREQFTESMLEKIDVYENQLGKQGLCKTTVSAHLNSLSSFFKYMRIPVKIEVFNADPVYHNRDITKEEIKRILNNSTPRDRAYYLMMLQSGLRPVTLVQLTYEQIKDDFESGKHPSCLIRVPHGIAKGEYSDSFTFMGPDAVEALKVYFKERGMPKDAETLFKAKAPNKFSMRFGYHVRSLELINPEHKRVGKKPQELRLYCLRKYFRKMAGTAGPDYVNFWMGHTLGVDDHYFNHDVELHRKYYEEKAMPNLQIYEPSPTDYTGQFKDLKKQLDQKDEAIKSLKKELDEKDTVTREIQETVAELKKQSDRFFGELTGDRPTLLDLYKEQWSKKEKTKHFGPEVVEELRRQGVPEEILKRLHTQRTRRKE